MHKSPGRYHLRKRSTKTVRSLIGSQPVSSWTRSSKKGAIDAMSDRNSSRPRRLISSHAPLRITNAHCQYSSRLSITMILPGTKRPSTCVGSLGLRVKRNQSTSMGAPRLSTRNPASSRTIDLRPSQPTTRVARTSISPSGVLALTPAIVFPAIIKSVTSACMINFKAG